MRFRCALIGVLLGFSVAMDAQREAIDSLRELLGSSKHDTNRVKTEMNLGWELMSAGNYDSALLYTNLALQHASEPVLPGGKAWDKGIAQSHNTLGVIFFNKGFYPLALQHYYKALRIQETLHDKRGVASIHNGIGNIYGIQNQFDLALKYHEIALQIRKELGNKRGMANSYGNIGNLYYNKNDYPEALKNYRLSLALMKETHNEQGIANAYGNIGIIHLAQNKLDEALKAQFSSLEIHQQIGDRQGEGITFINLAVINTKMEKYAAADIYANKALEICTEIGDLESMKDALQALSDLCEKTGRAKEAYLHYKSYIAARDSLLNEENTRESTRLEMNYEFDKKEAATRLEQEKKEAIAAAESRRQRIILWAISGFGILVLGFAIFAYRSFLQKRKANFAIMKQKDLIEEKQREILDSIHYARRIQSALLTSERYIARNLSRYIGKK